MNVQFLNGIDIQYLNGTEGDTQRRDAHSSVLDFSDPTIVGLASGGGIGYAINAMRRNRDNIDAVVNGYDLEDYSGLNTANDAEAVRNYIVRTKRVCDTCPELFLPTRNPETFSSMLGYVLKYWDTASRENALQAAAKEEQRLIRIGSIKTDKVQDGEYYKGGFFTALWDMFRPRTDTAREINGVLYGYKDLTRGAQARARETVVLNGVATTFINEEKLNQIAGTTYDEEVLSGSLLYGFNIPSAALGDVQTADVRLKHVIGLRSLMASRPELFFANDDDRVTTLHVLDDAIVNWRSMGLNGLDGLRFLKKAANAVKKGLKSAGHWIDSNVTQPLVVNPLKEVGKVVKNVAKDPSILINPVKATKQMLNLAKGTIVKPTIALAKATVIEPTRWAAKATIASAKAIAKITKKIVKFLIRFNPITLFIRAILLLAARQNWFNLAKNCYAGSFEYAEAMQAGLVTDAEDYERCQKNFKRFWNTFDKIGGIKSKLVHALEKGYTKHWDNSIEKPTFDWVKKQYNDRNKEVDDEVTADEAEIMAQNTGDTVVERVEVKSDNDEPIWEKGETEIDEVTNVVTAKQAVTLYADPNADKGVATLPAGARVMYDTTYNDAQFLHVDYQGKDYYARKSAFGLQEQDRATQVTNEYATTTDAEFYDVPPEAVSGFGAVTVSVLKGTKVLIDTTWSNPKYYHVSVNGKVGYMRKSAFGQQEGALTSSVVPTTTKFIKDYTTLEFCGTDNTFNANGEMKALCVLPPNSEVQVDSTFSNATWSRVMYEIPDDEDYDVFVACNKNSEVQMPIIEAGAAKGTILIGYVRKSMLSDSEVTDLSKSSFSVQIANNYITQIPADAVEMTLAQNANAYDSLTSSAKVLKTFAKGEKVKVDKYSVSSYTTRRKVYWGQQYGYIDAQCFASTLVSGGWYKVTGTAIAYGKAGGSSQDGYISLTAGDILQQAPQVLVNGYLNFERNGKTYYVSQSSVTKATDAEVAAYKNKEAQQAAAKKEQETNKGTLKSLVASYTPVVAKDYETTTDAYVFENLARIYNASNYTLTPIATLKKGTVIKGDSLKIHKPETVTIYIGSEKLTISLIPYKTKNQYGSEVWYYVPAAQCKEYNATAAQQTAAASVSIPAKYSKNVKISGSMLSLYKSGTTDLTYSSEKVLDFVSAADCVIKCDPNSYIKGKYVNAYVVYNGKGYEGRIRDIDLDFSFKKELESAASAAASAAAMTAAPKSLPAQYTLASAMDNSIIMFTDIYFKNAQGTWATDKTRFDSIKDLFKKGSRVYINPTGFKFSLTRTFYPACVTDGKVFYEFAADKYQFAAWKDLKGLDGTEEPQLGEAVSAVAGIAGAVATLALIIKDVVSANKAAKKEAKAEQQQREAEQQQAQNAVDSINQNFESGEYGLDITLASGETVHIDNPEYQPDGSIVDKDTGKKWWPNGNEQITPNNGDDIGWPKPEEPQLVPQEDWQDEAGNDLFTDQNGNVWRYNPETGEYELHEGAVFDEQGQVVDEQLVRQVAATSAQKKTSQAGLGWIIGGGLALLALGALAMGGKKETKPAAKGGAAKNKSDKPVKGKTQEVELT